MYFVVRYSRGLEEGYGRARWPDFAVVLVLGAAALLVIAPFTPILFFGSSLSSMLVYLWARRNPGLQISLLDLVTFTAPWLPWALLAFGALMGNDPLMDLLGIAVGHVLFFAEDVYPRLAAARGWSLTAIVPNPTNVGAVLRRCCRVAPPAPLVFQNGDDR